jgi:hypothetical protein
MKSLFVAASAVAVASLVPAMAQAQAAPGTGAYVNLGYARADTDPGKLDIIQGKVGYRFMPYLGIEGELATGLGSDSVTVPTGGTPATVSAKIKLKHEAAAYVVGFAPLSANTDVFARLGYGTTKVRVRGAGVSVSGSEESVNYGLGIQHHFDGVNGVRAEWTRLDFDNGGGSTDVFGVSYTRRF